VNSVPEILGRLIITGIWSQVNLLVGCLQMTNLSEISSRDY
jgi:hypothetical protein